MGAKVATFYHIFQDSAVADGNGTAMDVGGLSGVGVQIEGITTATINFEGTLDESTWYSVQAVNQVNGAVITSVSADGLFNVPIAGFQQLRCRISGYSAGTIVITGFGVVNPANVSIAGLSAGEDHIGYVGSHEISILQTLAVTVGAYVANDVVGGLITFPNAARVAGGGGVIKNVIVLDDAGQDAEMELWLFNATFTAMTDNAPWAPSEADLRKLVAVIRSLDGNWLDAGTPSALVVEASQEYDLVGTSMFGQLVTRGTPTFAATDDVTVIIGLLQG